MVLQAQNSFVRVCIRSRFQYSKGGLGQDLATLKAADGDSSVQSLIDRSGVMVDGKLRVTIPSRGTYQMYVAMLMSYCTATTKVDEYLRTRQDLSTPKPLHLLVEVESNLHKHVKPVVKAQEVEAMVVECNWQPRLEALRFAFESDRCRSYDKIRAHSSNTIIR